MTQISEIVDKDSLKTWLRDTEKSREVCVWIAHRAAMRVLPVCWDWVLNAATAEKFDLTAGHVLRPSLISGVAAACPTPEINSSAAAAAFSADSSSSAAAADSSSADSSSSAAAAAFSSAASAASSAAFSSSSAAFSSSAASSAAFSSSSAASSAWRLVQLDCALTEETAKPWDRPAKLYLEQDAPRWQVSWADLRSKLEAADDTDWTFWIDWYDRALAGTETRWDLLERIALSDLDPLEDGTARSAQDFSPFWAGRDADVNKRINEVVAQFAENKTRNAEALSVNEHTGKLRVDPITDLAPIHMQEAVEEIQDLINRLTNGADVPRNPLPLTTELEMLAGAYQRISSPRRLHSLCRSVLRRTQSKIANGDCPEPEKDPDMADLVGTLLDVTTTLIERDPEVREAVALTDQSPVLSTDGEAANAIAHAAREVAPLSEDVLAEELPKLASVMTDPDASEADRRDASFVNASRLIRVWRLVTSRESWEDLEKRTKPVAGAIKNAGVIAGAVTAPAWLPTAIQYILKLFT